MTTWTQDELDRIGSAEELQIASLRQNGTLRKPVTIWVVRVGDYVYVRSAYGRTPAWFRGTQYCRDGHIEAGGIGKDVTFADADTALSDEIDAAYRNKYRHHGAQYVDSIVTPDARSTTIRLMPR